VRARCGEAHRQRVRQRRLEARHKAIGRSQLEVGWPQLLIILCSSHAARRSSQERRLPGSSHRRRATSLQVQLHSRSWAANCFALQLARWARKPGANAEGRRAPLSLATFTRRRRAAPGTCLLVCVRAVLGPPPRRRRYTQHNYSAFPHPPPSLFTSAPPVAASRRAS